MTQTLENDTSTLETIHGLVDNARADSVFGAPISRDGLTILPVAKVRGGGGGGSSAGSAGERGGASGGGAGLGLSARPLGVFVLREGRVSWRPAVDVNRIVLGGQAVAITALLVLRAVLKRRHRPAARFRRPGRR
ncbi:hypothetical protein GCM10010123_36080 [Pilimelia anulata]|uniref:Sporulation protein YtfJ n=1 Tax=Pilimelia anulata TaxID=53371 RepID=A0A8J3FBS8_9ACTN|nr:spore germination protein GerW family protein [Pilimelia anulata]GGK02883.1 hypothetical protein GCM10010123_36080 [Pilimelia anulata]